MFLGESVQGLTPKHGGNAPSQILRDEVAKGGGGQES